MNCRSDQHVPRQLQDGQRADPVELPWQRALQLGRRSAQGNDRSWSRSAGPAARSEYSTLLDAGPAARSEYYTLLDDAGPAAGSEYYTLLDVPL